MREVVDALDSGLRERGWSVESVFVECGHPLEFEAWRSGRGSRTSLGPRVPLGMGPWNWLRRFWLLRGLVRRYRPDIVSVHFSSPHIPAWDTLALRRGNTQLVATMHGSHQAKGRVRLSTLLGVRFVDLFTAPSVGATRAFDGLGLPAERIRSVRNGTVPPPANAVTRAAGGPGRTTTVVGCVTRLVPEKHVEKLIQAMGLLNGEAVELVVVGDGPLRNALEEQATALAPGRVTFSGWQYDMDEVYDRIDILALSSLLEGLPLVVLEAAARGIPAVATDIPGTNEAVVDGVTGLLVPRNDADALAGAIRRLVRDSSLRGRLGDAARERVLRDFGQQAMVDGYDALFREALRARRSGRPKEPAPNSSGAHR